MGQEARFRMVETVISLATSQPRGPAVGDVRSQLSACPIFVLDPTKTGMCWPDSNCRIGSTGVSEGWLISNSLWPYSIEAATLFDRN